MWIFIKNPNKLLDFYLGQKFIYSVCRTHWFHLFNAKFIIWTHQLTFHSLPHNLFLSQYIALSLSCNKKTHTPIILYQCLYIKNQIHNHYSLFLRPLSLFTKETIKSRIKFPSTLSCYFSLLIYKNKTIS